MMSRLGRECGASRGEGRAGDGSKAIFGAGLEVMPRKR